MRSLIGLLCLLYWSSHVRAADLVTLTAQNWDQYAPRGKEVDCIYGDLVLQNDRITAVVAHPIAGRNANYRLREVGGAILDLTDKHQPNDQLSVFYPGAGNYDLRFEHARPGTATPLEPSGQQRNTIVSVRDTSVELSCRSLPDKRLPSLVVNYRLADGDPFLLVTSIFTNRGKEPLEVELADRVYAEDTFEYGSDSTTKLAWWYDKWFGQAYGIVAHQRRVEQGKPVRKKGSTVRYSSDDGSTVHLAPGGEVQLVRRIYPGKNLIDVREIANRLAGTTDYPFVMTVQDAAGPVAGADVIFQQGDKRYAWGRTANDGTLQCRIPAGRYQVAVESAPRGEETFQVDARREGTHDVSLPRPGYVEGRITNEAGGPIPCKIQFRGAHQTPDPDFGPDGGEHAVKNLYYTANGSFLHEMAPGSYDVIISHGPEYDAVFQTIKVQRGDTTPIAATLVRTVSTPGWVSTDFHSHSSPSGDNTASQYGRVLNLLAEHLEFAPCTEHNRLASYAPHLKRLDAEQLMATCVGIELTGSPGWVNHQNAFPLVLKPGTQDGSGPGPHGNPVVQIERLALWDGGSDKLIQQNHPNIAQILGDRDADGKADGGFEKIFPFMDVIEVQPPHEILKPPEAKGRNRIGNWLQMLNLGYRVPGVVNTDAHWNFHGSGWLRNYVKCPTDDPAQIKTLDIVHACERGNVIMTNGPYLVVQLAADGQTVTAGEDIRVSGGQTTVQLHVRVQCPNWFDVDRVQVVLNGRPREELNFRRRVSPDNFSTRTIRFEQTIPIQLEQDTHVIVVAIGEQSALGPVMGPDHAADLPVAVSNPIFVDVDGDGFTPNGDLLGVEIP